MILNETLTPRMQKLSILGSAVVLLLIINLIRKEYIRPGYAIIWCVTGVFLFILSLFSPLLFYFSSLIGIDYAPAAIFLVLLGGLLLISIHFSILVSKYERQIKDLAQEISLLKLEIKKLLKEKNNS